jgi:hypothetical protein
MSVITSGLNLLLLIPLLCSCAFCTVSFGMSSERFPFCTRGGNALKRRMREVVGWRSVMYVFCPAFSVHLLNLCGGTDVYRNTNVSMECTVVQVVAGQYVAQTCNLILNSTKETVQRWRLDSSGSRQGPVTSCCEYGNEPSGSIKGGEFLD